MERYQLTLAYDGSDFKGFQRQGKTRTVQLEVEQALRKLGWHGKSILSCGRTDAGVHAEGQVIAFDLEWKHTDHDLQNALNARLPCEVSIMDCTHTAQSFHPRFSAQSRTYLYQIFIGAVRQPLVERYAWRIEDRLDYQALRAAEKILPGIHDFKFVGRPMKEDGSTTRIVYEAKWMETAENSFEFLICANAFLYHMVRRLVFLQVKIARHRLSLDDFVDIIDAKKTGWPGIAPAHGLCLLKCNYEDWQQENM